VGLEAGIALPDVLPSAALRPVHFNKPTSGNDAYNGFSDTHPGIDMSDMSAGTRPSALSPLCRAEPGSVDRHGGSLEHGNWRKLAECQDWRGAPVKAAAPGLVLAAGVEDYGSYGKPHVVRILHGTLPDGSTVETRYLHLGSKVRDARVDASGQYDHVADGEPGQSYIQVTANQCLQADQPIGDQGYSGLTYGTHLHFEVLVAGRHVNPSDWFNRDVELAPPPQCS